MSARSAGSAASLGVQRPRIWSAPETAHSDIEDILGFAEDVGMPVDDAQAFVLERAMGLRGDGTWAARSVGVCEPRQNGKTHLLGLRSLYGVIVLGEQHVVHTAQLSTTAVEQFRVVSSIVEESRLLSKRLTAIDRGRGNERIEFAGGGRITYRARSGMSLRGLTLDCVILDEAAYLDEATMAAVQFALSARPNAQLWYAGTAVDQLTMKDGVVFARIRERGIEGSSRLAYFEWSADATLEELTREMVLDTSMWAQSNPALGTRILHEVVESEAAERDLRTFGVERLGIGDWPRTDDGREFVIPLEAWDACCDPESMAVDPIWMAYDVDPERSRATVSIAGRRSDGLLHVEPIEHFRNGIAGLLGYLVERYQQHMPVATLCDGASPAASLVPDLIAAGVPVTTLTAQEFARACGMFYDAATQATMRHRGGDLLPEAIRAASKRPLVDAWAFSRKNSTSDISPVVADAIALYGAATAPPMLSPEQMFSLV